MRLLFILIFFVITFFCSNICFSEVFKYKDEDGKTHFTDNVSNIPEQYRDQIKIKKNTTIPDNQPLQKSLCTPYYDEAKKVSDDTSQFLYWMEQYSQCIDNLVYGPPTRVRIVK